jgi:hypothetical protein
MFHVFSYEDLRATGAYGTMSLVVVLVVVVMDAALG